jgi:alkylation response protein AidB-like acyl-CoA dehydrogenase
MDPYDSPGEAAFRAAARAFLDANAAPAPPELVTASAIVAEWSPEEEAARLGAARRWQRLKYDAGWAGIHWPEEYGGRGGSLIEHVIFSQEEARYDVPHDALVVGVGWCGSAVLEHGSDAQRRRFLPRVLSGADVWCQLYSEPDAGSDLGGLRTRAIKDGDEWVLSGRKVWTTFAHLADWGLCIARHDPDAPKHRGLSAFLVDMDLPGVTASPLRQMTNSANFNEVTLDEVRVPDEFRIGAVGDGWRVVVSTFMWERVGALTGTDRILAALRRLIGESGAAGDPSIRERYAALYSRAEILRFNFLRMMTALSRGRLPGPEGSIMKLAGTSLLTDVYDLAVEIQGGAGLLAGSVAPWAGEWQSGFLGAPGLRIGGGTDEVQRNIIGERVLGLPGDIRVDKGVPFKDIPSG